MHFVPIFLCFAMSFWLTAQTHAEILVGVAAPLEDPNLLLGQQMRDGARVAAGSAAVRLSTVDDQCSAESGEQAAQRLIEAGVDIAVGFLCTETLEAALPLLTRANIPVITSGVRSNGITDRHLRTEWLIWRVAPRADAELNAIAQILIPRWRNVLFAIVDDGTIHGRELAESLRSAAELAGLKPVLVDTYRPQSDNQIGLVGRLRRAGASHVFVGGDRDDIAIMARDAAGLGYDLTLAGSEALRAAGEVPLAQGTLMVGVPEWADEASEAELALFRRALVAPEGYVIPTHAAVEVATQALRKAREDKLPTVQILRTETFKTLAGELRFDDKGDVTDNPFRLLRYDGSRFLPIE